MAEEAMQAAWQIHAALDGIKEHSNPGLVAMDIADPNLRALGTILAQMVLLHAIQTRAMALVLERLEKAYP
jgi:hypothetical protein